jgi:serine/threonine protein kinase
MDPLQPGDPVTVGSYRLLGRLGAGGMGQVFLGESPGGGRKVAVKVIHPVHAGNVKFRERFAREIKAARRVGGFHTALVVDADPDANPPWMVTAFIEGPSLQKAVDQDGPLPPDRVRALGAGLAEGLAAIHACGLVHRDLKPGNVILAADGPRIIDFGIARVIDASTPITNADGVLGTFAFMSPEHLRRDATVPASDVFSLGSVLAFAATGRLPFGEEPAEIIFRLVNQPPELTGLDDPELAGLIGRCLAKEPTDRPTVSGLLAAFAGQDPEQSRADAPGDTDSEAEAGEAPTTPRPSEGEPEPEPLPRPNRRRRWAVALIAVLAVALAITVPLVLNTGTTQTPPGASQTPGGQRSDATGGGGGEDVGGGGTTSSPDPGPTSPTTGSSHTQRPRPTISSNTTPTVPTAGPASSSPASPTNPVTSSSHASSGSHASPTSPQLVDIPDVIGLTPNQAIQVLENAGFVPVEVHRSVGPGKVFKYSPVGQAPRGSKITFYC